MTGRDILVLTLRTDKPDAEIGLYIGATKLAGLTWQAHRELAETIHNKMLEVLDGQRKTWGDLEGVVCFAGPGSFTGLRIGLSVANSLAYSLKIPIVAAEGDAWTQDGLTRLQEGKTDNIAIPNYGSEAHITLPKR